MKLTIGELRRVIVEGMVSASSLPPSVGLVMQVSDYSAQMALVDLDQLRFGTDEATLEAALIAGITASRLSNCWRVGSVWATKGYGPLMYRLMMQLVTSMGSSLSANESGQTSAAAQRVWDRFNNEPDVKRSVVDPDQFDVRRHGYTLAGDDYSALAARYDELGLSADVDREIKYNLFWDVRSRGDA